MQIKTYNRVYLFNKIFLTRFKLSGECIKIYFLFIRLFSIELYKFKCLSFLKRFFVVENKYDNLYIKLFGKIPFLKIECRESPYEKFNPKTINCFNIKHIGTLKRIKNKLKNNKKITVLFFVSRIGCFMWGDLYKLFKQNPIFDVKICVVPFSHTGKEEMVKYSLTAYNQLKEQGYNVIKAYDEITDTYLDIKKELKPDIIFHNKSWWKHLPKQYYLANFPKSLNYLIEYGISGAKNPDGHFNLHSHWLADTYFMPSYEHLNMAHEISKIKGKNCIFLGYPKLDVFFDKNYKPKDVWKKQDKPKKRIIWAPHWLYYAEVSHSISTFAEIYDFMLEIAEKYKDEIQFAFKPHPMLYKALQEKPVNGVVWSQEQIDNYYNKWAILENCQFENDRFEDLFLTSDAMIFDSISFMAEYMVTGKPSLFTSGEKNVLDFDEFGLEVYSKLYQTKNLKNDIETFIQNIVLNENDYRKNERQEFIENYLKAPNNASASQNIYNNIIETLRRK